MCMQYTSLGSMWTFVLKTKPLLVRFNNVHTDLKFPQHSVAGDHKKLYYHGNRMETKLCKSTAIFPILLKIQMRINLQFLSTCYLSNSYFSVSVFKLGMWTFPFSYVVWRREEEEKITQ